MIRRTLLTGLLALPALSAARATPADGAPVVFSPGRLALFEAFPSRHVAARKVYVWTPRGYEAGRERLDVVYMADGQSLFRPDDAFNHQTWQVAEHLQALIDAGAVRPAMIVGVWNTPLRGREYAPIGGQDARGQARLAADWGGEVLSDAYVRFVAEELKPFVDSRYRARPDPAHTHLMGSSMGGLISLDSLILRPDLFGASACLSTHWPIRSPVALGETDRSESIRIGQAFLTWVDANLPTPGGHRLYFDHGDQGLDAYYAPFQARMDDILKRHGYVDGVDSLSLVFPGADHNEQAWRARVDRPLSFLLGAKPRAG